MASWTTPTTHSSGDTLAVTDWNAVANNETFLYQAPYANYYNSVVTSLATNAITQVTLGGTTFSGYGWSVSSNNAIVPLTGIYWVAGGVGAIASGGQMVTIIEHNGTIIAQGFNNLNTNGINNPISTLVKATATDTLGLYAFQGSGGPINSFNNADETFLASFFIGAQ